MIGVFYVLKQYVDDLKTLSLDKLKKKNLDINFGKILYSTEDRFSLCCNIDIATIKTRIIMNPHGQLESMFVFNMDESLEFYNNDSNAIATVVNDIFMILENVTGESISSLSNGMFDYYDIV